MVFELVLYMVVVALTIMIKTNLIVKASFVDLHLWYVIKVPTKQVMMVNCYEHAIQSVESMRRLVGGSSDTLFQLNERQCQILVEELVETRASLEKRSVCSKFGQGVGSISLRHLCSTIQKAEVLVKKCCCKDLESWLASAMMLVEVQEEFMAIILDIHLWRMFLDFAITCGRGLSQEKKVEEMKIMDEEYHQLFKDLRRESHALQQAAVEDKGTIILRTSKIVDLCGSTNGLDYLRAIYMQSWLTNSVSCRDMELRKYEYVNVLGQGGCGTVLKVKWLGVECALKVLPGQDEKEAIALKGLFHPNIIRLFHYWEDCPEDPQSRLLMELMPKDLGAYMKGLLKGMSSSKMQMEKDTMPFSLPVAIDIMYQIAQAMRYMHEKHLTHRDLKPANILVKERPRVGLSCTDGAGYLDVKLVDFGLVKSYTNTSTFQAHSRNKGTRMYRAPEILGNDMAQKRHYLPMADVWSFGITCAEILSGKQAYVEYVDNYGLAIQTMISKGLRPTLPKHCPPYLAFCIKSCWEYLPFRRPSFGSLCKLLRHAKLLSLGVMNLDDSKFFFAYTTRSGQVQSLKLSSSSSKARISTFFQSSLKFMGIGTRPMPKSLQLEKQAPPQDAVAEATIAEASVSTLEDDTSEERSKDELETLQNGKGEAPEIKGPLMGKQFQRSDSLLAVQDVEDSKARAFGDAAAAASRDELASAETEIPDSNNNIKVEEEVVVAPISKTSSTTTTTAPPSSDALETHSANELRVLGNLMFGEENFAGAADLYTRSIRLAEAEEHRQGKLVRNSEIILGYSNRAEAYIRLQEFGKALADAKKALSRDPSHLKSLFWKGRALLGLSQYEQALTTLQAAAPPAPTNRDLQAALHESSTGVQQSCHGHYDLAHYYLKGKQAGESPFSADYVGPVIVTDVGRGRGRGLVLTKDVDAGELLLVSNPMAFLALQDVDQTRRDISQAFVDGKVQEGFRHVFETAHHKGLEKLPTLCDGEKSLPAPSVHQTDAESGEHELHLDHARIRRIIQLNAINGDATMGWKNLPGSGEQDKKVEHWGLWWLPSFINHSCLPSCSPILVGKALFVFAARDLRAGEEVTRAYFDIFQPLDQRKELSAKGWGFVCYCPRCKLEDALHSSLSKVTEQYTKLMELASKSKSEFGTDEQLSDTQTSAALKFFHKLESKLKDFKLNAAENNWVRSSFLHYIDMISGDHELHTHLESIVEALVTVCPGSETSLHMAVVAKDSARRTFGKKSTQFKAGNHRALNICRFTYGKQKASVLQSIVDRNDYQS